MRLPDQSAVFELSLFTFLKLTYCKASATYPPIETVILAMTRDFTNIFISVLSSTTSESKHFEHFHGQFVSKEAGLKEVYNYMHRLSYSRKSDVTVAGSYCS